MREGLEGTENAYNRLSSGTSMRQQFEKSLEVNEKPLNKQSGPDKMESYNVGRSGLGENLYYYTQDLKSSLEQTGDFNQWIREAWADALKEKLMEENPRIESLHLKESPHLIEGVGHWSQKAWADALKEKSAAHNNYRSQLAMGK